MRFAFTEFRVGAFVLVGAALIVGGWFFTTDGVKAGQQAYTLTLAVPNADGLWEGSPVKIAGVQIGSVSEPVVKGDHAEVGLHILPIYEIPVDSFVEVRATGLLGDRYVTVLPGQKDELLGHGDAIRLRDQPADMDQIQRDVQTIASDMLVVSATLREIAESDDNKMAIEGMLANLEALTAGLSAVATRNADDIDRIVASVERLTAHLEVITASTGEDIDAEMVKVQAATDTLQAALDDLASITAKVDAGEGTLGALINDDQTILSINDTLGRVNGAVRGVGSMRAGAYYVGRVYLGTAPTDPAFYYGNPLSGQMSNAFGVRLIPAEDLAFLAELVWHPQGTIAYEESWVPDGGTPVREYVRRPGPRISAMFEKRWSFVSVRLGIKESSPGVGATLWLVNDRLRLGVDVFDARLGSYPATEAEGIPNARIGLEFEPWRGVSFEVGSEQVILGARYGYFTGYVGVGFAFFGKPPVEAVEE